MSDMILDRLRHRVYPGPKDPLYNEAADEIERLREEDKRSLKIIRELRDDVVVKKNQIGVLRGKVEELEKIISEILNMRQEIIDLVLAGEHCEIITRKQIDAAWERIHKPGFDPTSSAVILEGFKMLGIVRCDMCDGQGAWGVSEEGDTHLCDVCNGHGWRKTCKKEAI